VALWEEYYMDDEIVVLCLLAKSLSKRNRCKIALKERLERAGGCLILVLET
jgi:hypothetical protein